MALPFLPSGVSELPARRFVLFADSDNRVQKQDESEKLADGAPFSPVWVSPSLNRGEPSFLWTIMELQLIYTAEDDTSITVEASGNGGDTWVNFREVDLFGGTSEVRSVNVRLNATGDDVRVRVTFNTDNLVNLLGYRPRLIQRGDVRYD